MNKKKKKNTRSVRIIALKNAVFFFKTLDYRPRVSMRNGVITNLTRPSPPRREALAEYSLGKIVV